MYVAPGYGGINLGSNMNIVESLWTASRLAVSDRIIDKLRQEKSLDDADLKYLKDWFCSEYSKSTEKMDSGKIFFLLVNTENFNYLGTLEAKLWNKEELSKEDLEFILNGVVSFRSDLIDRAC